MHAIGARTRHDTDQVHRALPFMAVLSLNGRAQCAIKQAWPKAALACTDYHYWVTAIVSEATRSSLQTSWWPLIQLQSPNNDYQYKQVWPLAMLASLHTEP